MQSFSVVQKEFYLRFRTQKKIRKGLKIHEAWFPQDQGQISGKGSQIIFTFLAMFVSADVISSMYTCGQHNQQLKWEENEDITYIYFSKFRVKFLHISL